MGDEVKRAVKQFGIPLYLYEGGTRMSVKPGQRIKEPEINHDRLGKAIRLQRLRFDWSIDELSQKSGIPRDEISRIELGTTRKPSYESITKLGLALGWEPNQIAQMTGMWEGEVDTTDERVNYMLNALKRLSGRDRERLTDQVYMAAKIIEGSPERN